MVCRRPALRRILRLTLCKKLPAASGKAFMKLLIRGGSFAAGQGIGKLF